MTFKMIKHSEIFAFPSEFNNHLISDKLLWEVRGSSNFCEHHALVQSWLSAHQSAGHEEKIPESEVRCGMCASFGVIFVLWLSSKINIFCHIESRRTKKMGKKCTRSPLVAKDKVELRLKTTCLFF